MITEMLDVLLVEDSPTDVLLTEEALSQVSRFRLRSSERLSEALRLLSEAHFDVVLLDLGLPDSQGLETLRRVRNDNTNVAIIVLTGKDDEELALRALQEGADDYLGKGEADAGQLRRSIRYALERRKVEESLKRREEHIRLLLDSTAEAIYGIDLKGNCTFANRACARLLGYTSADELLSKHMHNLMHHTHPDGSAYAEEECRILPGVSAGRRNACG